MYQLDRCLCCTTPLDWVAVMKFKTTKLILMAFPDFPQKLAPPKITHHTVSSCRYATFYTMHIQLLAAMIQATANIRDFKLPLFGKACTIIVANIGGN